MTNKNPPRNSGINVTDPYLKAVTKAYILAGERNHEYVTIEHLLAALLEADDVKKLIVACGANIKTIAKKLYEYLDNPENHEIITIAGAYQPKHTEMFKAVLKKAKAQNLFSSKEEVTVIELFLAIFNIENSYSSFLLYDSNLEREDILTELKRTLSVDEYTSNTKEHEELLSQYCINLNERAASGKIDPLIGRDNEVEFITQILARRSKNNVIMIGDPGVGKTLLVEGLAKRIIDKDVPETLLNKTIWNLDIASIVAGTKFRGDFEERIKQLVSAFKALPNAIVFIDEIHTIMSAGTGSNSAMDAANLLKPALSRGEIRCIGSTTNEEYRKFFEKDRALSRRFQRLDVHEPSAADTKKILKAIAPFYESHHGVKYSDSAIEAAVDLSIKYIQNKYLPDKAIDLLDSTGAKQQIKPSDLKITTITDVQVQEEVTRITGIPVTSNKEEITDLENLETDLKSVVFGQDAAIKSVVDAVLIGRSGLRDGTKTQGAFLFTGPSGTGKTEIAKQLAALLNINFVRFDMSEYQERHSVAKFIGSPPGYVGYGDGNAGSGILINTLDRSPYSLILCDEIEKAHPDITNIFLQILDNGSVSSQDGKTVSAKNAIIIFTSNLGASAMEKPVLGFGNAERDTNDQTDVNMWFKPEFRNRLDGIISFNRLSKDNMDKILDKFIKQLNVLSESKNVVIGFNTAAKEWLITRGFDRNMGARPLSRVIDKHVKQPLSRELLFGKLKNGGTVMFSVENDSLVWTIVDTTVDNEIAIETANLL